MVSVFVPTFLLIPAGEPKVIASLVSLSLNGEVNGDIQAQILIENVTTHEMEENVELIMLIESDLNILEDMIQGIEEISIYDYSSTPLPGRIDVFLESVEFRDKKFLKEINSIIESDRDKWWYTEGLVFTPIQEEIDIVDAYNFYYCGKYAGLFLLAYESSQRYDENVTLQSNETIIASYWIIENGSWTINEDFVNVVDKEILSLSEKIVGIEEIINPYQEQTETLFDETWINLKYPEVYNLTEPIPNSYKEFLGETYINIVFSKDASRTERNAASKIFLRIALSKWYVQDYYPMGPCDFGEDMIRFFIGMGTLFFVCIAIIPVITYRLVKKARRRKKLLG